jgi:endonuclease YncB( thermonuclease family)
MKRTYSTRIALLCLLLATGSNAGDEDFSGIVTHVFDGDSFLVRPSSGRDAINVRLMDIDAPEKDQPYAHTARSALIGLIEGRRVFVDVIEIDRYDRKIAKVYREPDRLEVARTLVHDGHVWVNRKYAKDPTLAKLEDTVRAKHQGLWSLPAEQLMPPWQFRRKTREQIGHKAHDRKEIPRDKDHKSRTGIVHLFFVIFVRFVAMNLQPSTAFLAASFLISPACVSAVFAMTSSVQSRLIALSFTNSSIRLYWFFA